jgi:gentisate 1,2-dioxygenase
MSEPKAKFVDKSGRQTPDKHIHGDHSLVLWEPVVISKEDIEGEVERLAGLAHPNNGVRRSMIAHPEADERSLGLAPGIDVSVDVLLPGERTQPVRQNSNIVNFCIQGAGSMVINGETFEFSRYDVVTTPSMAVHEYVNETDELQVRLRYSNGAMLERLNIHMVDEDPPLAGSADDDMTEAADEMEEGSQSPYGTFELTDDGGWLMPYEKLINPDPVEIKPHHWPWKDVKAELDKLVNLGPKYKGRRLYLLYDPVTGRTNGTTPNFFATMTIRPGGIVDRPHRHASAAMNYYFAGNGHSVVEGKRYPWKAGDLMLSAPGWAIHNHASDEGPVYELTIQDMPVSD